MSQWETPAEAPSPREGRVDDPSGGDRTYRATEFTELARILIAACESAGVPAPGYRLEPDRAARSLWNYAQKNFVVKVGRAWIPEDLILGTVKATGLPPEALYGLLSRSGPYPVGQGPDRVLATF